MVYFPKPGLFKEWGCEFLGSLLIYVITSTVVAVTGGSLAFGVNANQVAIAHGFTVLAVMGLLPFVHFNPIFTMYMIFNDLICWVRGKEGPLYIVRYLGHLVLQIVAAIVAALITWIYIPRGGPIHLGMTRVPAATSDTRAFFGLAVSAAIIGIVWLIASENATALYSYGMHKLKSAYKAKNPNKSTTTAQKNLHPGRGQMALFIASMVRAFIIAGAFFGVTFLSQPIAGYSVNPTQWLGYAIVSGKFDSTAWIPALAPFAGGFVAYLMYLPYTFASTWGPFTRYYGRGLGRSAVSGTFGRFFQ